MDSQHLLPIPQSSSQVTTSGISLEDLLSAFLSDKSPRTLEAYRRDLVDFQTFLGVSSLTEASRALLSAGPGQANLLSLHYKQHLHDRNLQPTTINRRLSALRSLCVLAKTLGLIPWTLEIKNQKVVEYRDLRGPSTGGMRNLLRQVEDRNDKKGIRDKSILRLLYDLGLRRGEIVSLDLEDLDLAHKTLRILGKGRTQKERLTLPDRTAQALKDWIEMRGEFPGPLFISLDPAQKGNGRLRGRSIHRLVSALGKRLGMTVRPHGIRHASITEALRRAQANGYDIEEVMDFSRHKDVRTLLIYRDKERNTQGSIASLVSESV